MYSSGELLSAVQLSGLFEDSKEFVDMPMKVDPEQILEVIKHSIGARSFLSNSAARP